MLKNYFKVAFRSLLKRKGYSLINILGLATGNAGKPLAQRRAPFGDTMAIGGPGEIGGSTPT